MAARDKLILALFLRYSEATRTERGGILDEFIAVTGYHRKYAAQILSRGFLPRGFKPRYCIICEIEFTPTAGSQLACSALCRRQHKKEVNRQYRELNRERIKEVQRQRNSLPEARQTRRQYYEDNRDRYRQRRIANRDCTNEMLRLRYASDHEYREHRLEQR